MRLALVTLHRWLGLFSAVFLAIAGLTGAIIAWDHELDGWLNPELFHAEVAGRTESPLVLADRVEATDPRLQVTFMSLALEPGHTAVFGVAPRNNPATGKPHELGFDQVFLEPHSGALLGTRQWGEPSLARKSLMPFLYRLHYTLHLPESGGVELGTLLMGIVALVWFLDAFVALSISFPRGSAWIKSFVFRVRAGGYRLIFDLHRSSGVWLWPLLLVFALTAVDMNLGRYVVRPVVGLFSPLTPSPFDEERAPRAEEQRVPRRQIIENARVEARRRGLSAPVGGIFYAPLAGLYGVGFYEPGDDHGDGGLGNPWLYFDGATGKYVSAQVPGEGSAGDFFMQLQFPIHSGRIAGLAGRVIITLLGLVICTLSVTGIVIWARKRRGRQRAAQKRAPRLEPTPSTVRGASGEPQPSATSQL